MAKTLVVPICLDALVLDKPTAVVEAFADFSRLPYFDSAHGRDINPDIPYLSEDILSTPLQAEALYLPAGIHLHWVSPLEEAFALVLAGGMLCHPSPLRLNSLVARAQEAQGCTRSKVGLNRLPVHYCWHWIWHKVT